MPTLPTASDVIALTETSLPALVVESLIADAALVACDCIAGYEPDRQTAIIKWLAAHMVASTDAGGGTLTSEKLGDASLTYARATLGEGLKGTIYGQQALALDPKGCLVTRGKGRASVEII